MNKRNRNSGVDVVLSYQNGTKIEKTMDKMTPVLVIEDMVELKRQVDQLQTRITGLKDRFMRACDAVASDETVNRIRIFDAWLQRSKTPGVWDYDSKITVAEKKVKAMKKFFQDMNDPVSGWEPIWTVRVSE